MKLEMRRSLARESFPEKVRKVGELLQLSAKLKPERTRATRKWSRDRVTEIRKNPLIISAIRRKAVLRFTYNGKVRIVEPQTYGISTAGSEVLRAFERNPDNIIRSGVAKLFDLGKVSGLQETGQRFRQALAAHNPEDSAMVEVFATLPKPGT